MALNSASNEDVSFFRQKNDFSNRLSNFSATKGYDNFASHVRSAPYIHKVIPIATQYIDT